MFIGHTICCVDTIRKHYQTPRIRFMVMHSRMKSWNTSKFACVPIYAFQLLYTCIVDTCLNWYCQSDLQSTLNAWYELHHNQWCIAKHGGGYRKERGIRVYGIPCLFMITEVSIRCQKTRRLVYGVYPKYTTDHNVICTKYARSQLVRRMCLMNVSLPHM